MFKKHTFNKIFTPLQGVLMWEDFKLLIFVCFFLSTWYKNIENIKLYTRNWNQNLAVFLLVSTNFVYSVKIFDYQYFMFLH